MIRLNYKKGNQLKQKRKQKLKRELKLEIKSKSKSQAGVNLNKKNLETLKTLWI
jgi:hypothetical protein